MTSGQNNFNSAANVVNFGTLTDKEVEYCRLVATSDFFQLVRTKHYMENDGLSFKDATIKYLQAKKDASNKTREQLLSDLNIER